MKNKYDAISMLKAFQLILDEFDELEKIYGYDYDCRLFEWKYSIEEASEALLDIVEASDDNN